MAKTTIAVADYRIQSTFTVKDGRVTAQTGVKTLTVSLETVPTGDKITSAYLQATYRQMTSWDSELKVNGVVTPKRTVQTPVTIPEGAIKVDIPVSFRTYGSASATAGLHYDSVEVSAITLVVESESSVSKCGAPTSGSISRTEVTTADPVRINWEGATPGAGSTISGYTLQRAQSIDNGQHWSDWEGVITVEHQYHDTTPGAEGTWRKYRVRANSSAGEAYNSAWYNIPGTLHRAGEYDDGTQPHNNMPPYRVVHMWRRKA